jgi:hypothetical protein
MTHCAIFTALNLLILFIVCMKKLLLLLAISSMSVLAMGQERLKSPVLKNEFGIHAGATTGLGLSYRHWFDRAGFQLTALPVKAEDVTLYSAGVSLLYTFYESKYSRFYGYVGNHYWYNQYDEYVYGYDNNGNYTESVKKVTDEFYNLGVGPAFAFGKVVRVNIMVGYAIYDVFNNGYMMPTGEIGLYYNF